MFTLQILHASDLEGGVDAIENAPNFAAIVDALEAEAEAQGLASILLSSGDNYIPGPFFNAGGDFGTTLTQEGFYNAFFGLIDTSVLADEADTNGDGFFDNDEIQAEIDAGNVTFEAVYTTDVNGDGFADYFEEIDASEGRIDVSIANALGFDASAVGNHEFDAGTDIFENAINYDSEEGNGLSTGRYGNINFLQEVDTPGVQFPYLSANLDFSEDFDVGALFQNNILLNTAFQSDLSSARVDVNDPAATGSDSNDQKIAPATIIERDGEQIGVVGATTQLVSTISSTGSVEDVSSPGVNDMAALAAVLQPVIDDLIAQGVNKIILTSHLQQFSLEQELATLLTGVDIILAGGSDTISADGQDRLRAGDEAEQPYPFTATAADGNPTLIVSTDGEYSYVGRLVVEFDDNGVVIPESVDENVSGTFATDEQGVLDVTGAATLEEAIAGSEKASQVEGLAGVVTDIVTELDGDIAGETTVFLNGEREDVRTQETNFGNLTADANIAAVNAAGFDAVVSIKNGGGIRAPIGAIDGLTGDRLPTEANPLSGKEEGQISELDIDNALRFNNGLSVLELSSEGLLAILEHGVAATAPGNTPGQFPQIGGVQFSFDPDLPSGSRVLSVALLNEDGTTGQVIVRDGEVVEGAPESIAVVTLDFLAGGGDGYPFAELALNGITDTGIGEQEALSDFLTANHPEDGDTDFAQEDTAATADTRIQNLSVRSDAIDVPQATGDLEFSVAAVFDSGVGEGGSEVVAHEDGRLYVTNGAIGAIDVFDIASETRVDQIDLTFIPGFAGLQSVDIKNGIIAAAVSTPDVTTEVFGQTATVGQDGFIVLIDAATGQVFDRVTVGNLPDSVKFNADGTKLVVANEGEFNAENGLDGDPIGSISVIDLTNPANPVVTNIDFSALDGFEDLAREAGIRITPGQSILRNLEPEFVDIEGDTAFVTLQEANAVAVIDLTTNSLVELQPLGLQDHSVVALDPNNDGIINIRTFDNLVGIRMPDAIDAFTLNGQVFYATANEGDDRGDAVDGGDAASVEEILAGEVAGVSIDASVDTTGLENLTISTIDGDTDGDGDIDILHATGSRSFTIFDAEGNIVFDSGSEFEEIISQIAPERFNDDDGDDGEDRSDNKGPEPEAIAVGTVGENTYAFIGAERDSGIFVYDITDPANAFFVEYITGFDNALGDQVETFQSPEVITFIPAEESTSGFAQIAVAYEISGDTVVFDIFQEGQGGNQDAPIFINEVRIDEPGTDNSEYFELFGEAGASLDGLSYVTIGDGAGGSGVVETVVSLDGFTLDENGLFLVTEEIFALTGTPDLIASLNFENSDNVTHLLVRDFAGAEGDDLDVDEDGVLDVALDVVDSVAIVEDLANGEFVYSDTQVGPDGTFVPGHVFRLPDGGDFQIGAFDPVEGDDTPGASNEGVLPVFDLQITEIWSGQDGDDLTEDWFEITNIGDVAWTFGVDADLFYDDESADPTAADLISGIDSIGVGESVIVVIGDAQDALDFVTVWGDAIDLSNVEVGFTDGAGLGAGGDAVNLFVGDPLGDGEIVDSEAYPDTAGFSGQSFDVDLQAFSTVDNEAGAVATNVTAGELGDEPAIASPGFTVDNPNEVMTITRTFEIQGEGHISPFVDQEVTTTGIVVAVDGNRFFIQDAEGDGNLRTSDGLEIFTGGAPGVSVGDEVVLTGTVSEFIPGGADTGNLSITQIAFPTALEVVSSGNALPAATVIGANGRAAPTEVVISEDELPVNLQDATEDAANTFNPEVDGIDFYESLEGMLVTIDDPVAISATNGFGETFVVTDDGAGVTSGSQTGGLNDRGALEINADINGEGDLNPERIQIQFDSGVDGGASQPGVSVGDNLGDVTGVVSYSFGNYEVLAQDEVIIETPTANTAEITTIAASATELTVATYNVLNVTSNPGDGDQDQIALLAQQIVANLGSPDILGLQEIQDNSGVTDDGVLSADETLQALVDAIVAAGGPEYSFASAEVDVDGETGGVPGGNIRNAFLFNEARVTPVEITTLEVDELTAFGVTDPNTFDGTRDPLLGTFEFNGEQISIVNNHFSSRFGSEPIFGAFQPFNQGGEAEREAQALAINEVVDALIAGGQENVVVLGDLNTFDFTDELVEDLPGVGDERVLTNLIGQLDEDDRYTFIFQGNAQVLDHIFVTDALLEGAEVDIVHVNNDFPVFASDHEPVLAKFDFDNEVEGIVFIGDNSSETIIGGEGDDLLGGEGGNDLIEGLGGVDLIDGGRGADQLFGGNGNDFIFGGAQNDLLDGGEGDDELDGGVGFDQLFGGNGDDILDGAQSSDELFGGEGSDLLIGGAGLDLLDGGAGDDELLGGVGHDSLFGGDGNDILNGEQSRDLLNGGAGDDELTGGAGPDTFLFEGDFGADIVTDLANADDLVFEGVTATDVVISDDGIDTLITVTGMTTFGTVTVQNTTGLEADDLIFG